MGLVFNQGLFSDRIIFIVVETSLIKSEDELFESQYVVNLVCLKRCRWEGERGGIIVGSKMSTSGNVLN